MEIISIDTVNVAQFEEAGSFLPASNRIVIGIKSDMSSRVTGDDDMYIVLKDGIETVGYLHVILKPFRDDERRVKIDSAAFTRSVFCTDVLESIVSQIKKSFDDKADGIYFEIGAVNSDSYTVLHSIGFENERVQVVKGVDPCTTPALKSSVRLYSGFLRNNLEQFSGLFEDNLKAHVLTNSFDTEYAKMKMLSLADYLDDNKAICFYEAKGDLICGFIWGYIYPAGSNRLLIGAVQVHESFRSNGIGEHLMRSLEYEASKEGLTSIYTHTDAVNAKALKFYHRLGYNDEQYQMYLNWRNQKWVSLLKN